MKPTSKQVFPIESSKTTTLIGQVCKGSNVLSLLVLILNRLESLMRSDKPIVIEVTLLEVAPSEKGVSFYVFG